jgi:hypothetical protein
MSKQHTLIRGQERASLALSVDWHLVLLLCLFYKVRHLIHLLSFAILTVRSNLLSQLEEQNKEQSTMLRLLTAFLLLVVSTHAWTFASSSHRGINRISSVALFSSESSNVESISLDSLTDHEQEGTLLSESIARWLDAEWMPQDIHAAMGESAKRSYIEARTEGDGEMMSIMMRIATDLESNWMEDYDADAFCNAWDVANYVSDYLTKKSGSESCDCSSEIF